MFPVHEKDHQRDKRPASADLLENKNGKVPVNYESAHNKAKMARVEAKKKSKGAHVKTMETEEIDRNDDTEDEDISSDEEGESTLGFAMTAKGVKPKAARSCL